MVERLSVTVSDGKYTVIQDINGLYALRYGEEWRELTGDGLILALAMEVQELRDKLAEHYALGLLSEEFGESLQWIGKALRFGIDVTGLKDPVTGQITEHTARSELPKELGDVLAAIVYAGKRKVVDDEVVGNSFRKKLKRLLDPDSKDSHGGKLAP